MELAKAYEPENVEQRWYQVWLDGNYFHADENSDKPPYTIVIPPPNVTGSLHMGHALTNTIQDILTRYKRMSGFNALWLPGMDHAGIATQMVVEKSLAKQGISRHDLGREKFLEHVWAWKEQYGARIGMQLRRLGSSLDWERERFTMDEGLSRATREVFVRLYEEGLIYQDHRLVNWDPVGQTVLSDLEVEQEEEDGFLWHLAYPVEGTDEKLVVATTRPETMLGDTAVAIHPEDERYKHLHGKRIALPLTDRTIPIVCDPEAADMDFGSGAVKITPAHDFNDFETGRRNGLDTIAVIGLDACMNENTPERFRGLDRYDARKAMLAELRESGVLVKEEPYKFMPGRSQRSGAVVEPLSIGMQWYVRMAPLAAPAIEAVRDGSINFVPKTWEKTYFHWMENVRDWCISRQLWWGHRIPAWTCGACEKLTVARVDPTACSHCGAEQLTQDEDVLDTWFSSGLWPFSTLGWPEQTQSLKTFYPTTVMETGFDIIFFWVARMIFFGIHFMDEVPFKTVFLHAMVRDRHGAKMSKTKGNVIDPLHLIDGVNPSEIEESERALYSQLLEDFPDGIRPQGADALRLTLAVYAAAGRDIKLDVKRVEGYKAFINKLWNASRFAMMNLEDYTPRKFDADSLTLSPADMWVLTRLRHTAEATVNALDEYRFNDAAQALYEFVWHELCDWYLELSKPILYQSDPDFPGDRESTQVVLSYVMDQVLRLLHPIIPFVTEEIWAALAKPPTDEPVLCVAAYPSADSMPHYPSEAAAIQTVTDVITGIRNIRGESNISMGVQMPRIILVSDDAAVRASLQTVEGYVRKLARVDSVEISDSSLERPAQAATSVRSGVEIIIPLQGLIDVEAERARIEKQLAKLDKDIKFFAKKLNNPKFVDRAPEAVLAKDRAKLAAFEEERATLADGLKGLEAFA